MKLPALSDKNKGYVSALVATIAFSNVYIFSKAALNEIALPQFLLWWFGLAFSINLILGLAMGSFKELKHLHLRNYAVFLKLGIIEIITTTTFYISLNIIPDPAVTSFIGNMFVVFLVLLGVIILKERFTRLESVGVLITIFGAFAVGYKGGTGISDFFVAGTGMVLINTFFAALSSIFAKKAIRDFSPNLINVNRTLFMFLFGLIYFMISGESTTIPASAIKNITIGVLLGPVIGIWLIYISYKYIEASRSSVLQGLKGVFVLAGTFLYFNTLPSRLQLIGGLVSVFGVLLMTMSKAKMLTWKAKK